MKITCESCSAKYTIADDKVRGRKVKIRCKGCGTPIVVDGKQPGSAETDEEVSTDSDVPAALDAAPAASAPAGSSPRASSPSASTPLAGNDVDGSVNLSDTDQRTLTTQQIVEAWQSGVLNADAFVWREGQADWLPILECADLAPKLVSSPSAGGANGGGTPGATSSSAGSAAATRPAASGAARVAPRRNQAVHDLFAGLESAGADGEELATSAPVLPQAGSVRPPADDRMTGARNENSVLFSLDALKAGFSGAPAKVEPATAKERSRPSTANASDDPFGMGAPNSVAGMGGSNPLFSFSDNQALLTAPPPPPQPPPRPVQAVPSGAPAHAEAPRSKKTLVALAAGAVALLAAGLVLGIGLAGDDDETKAAAVASEEARAKEQSQSEESASAEARKKDEEAKAEAAKAETAKAEEAKAQEAKAEAAKGEAAKGDANSAGRPGTEQSAGKSSTATPAGGKTEPVSSTRKEATKETSTKKEEPKVAAAAGAGDQPFSKGAAVAALTAAASQSASCKKLGGPTGTGKVTVTFAPSGRVTAANVSGPPFAGTSVGGCVASVFRKAKVPAFTGNALTVSKSFAIR